MPKVWGRDMPSNVQKVMWAVTEIGAPCERIDIGEPFGWYATIVARSGFPQHVQAIPLK